MPNGRRVDTGRTAAFAGTKRFSAPRRGAGGAWLRRALFATALLGSICIVASAARAIDGSWLPAPATSNWNTGTNWSSTPAVPDGTASFGNSNTTSLTFSAASTSIGTIQLNAGAPAYTFNLNSQTLNVTGTGVVDNSSNRPTFNLTGNSGNNILNFTNAASAGDSIVNVNPTTAGQVIFNDNSNAGSATLNNVTGELEFKNSSSAANATIILGAAATQSTFDDFSTAANARFTIAAGSNGLAFLNASSAGNAAITNAGFLTFVGSSTANDATVRTPTAANAIITNNTGGQLSFGAFTLTFPGGIPTFNPFIGTGSAGNAAIINNSGGSTTFFNQSDAGTANITNNSGGKLLFVNAGGLPTDPNAAGARVINNAGGQIDISQVTTGVSIGSVEGAGQVLLGSKTLTTGATNLSTTIGGVLSDGGAGGGTSGSLVKIGIGTLTLSGNNTYTGGTTIDGGTLSVNGSIGAVTVNPGGTLGGNGTVGSTTVNGTLSPGNSIGLLTIQGNLVFTTAASYLVQISGPAADKTVVTGTATLAGNVLVEPLTHLGATTTYTILTSGGLNGTTFAGVSLIGPSGFARNPRLAYVGNNVLLTLDPGLLTPFLPFFANTNQRNVAAALDTAVLAGETLPVGINVLFNLSGANLLNALTVASGELPTASQQTTFNAMALFLGLMTDPFVAGRIGQAALPSPSASHFADEDDALAYEAYGKKRSSAERAAYAAMYRKAPIAQNYDPRWSVWASAFGGSQTTDGNALLGSNNATSRIFGGAVGADYLLSPQTLVGFALAGGGTNFAVANSLGSGRSDLFQAGTFVRHNMGPAYVTAGLAYGWQDITTDRTVTIAGADLLHANFNGNTLSGRVEGGYRFATVFAALTPYAAGQFSSFWLPAYAEQVVAGSNSFALAYSAKTVTDSRSELGLRADKSFALSDGVLTLRGRAAWAHNFNQDRSIGATFQTLPVASFVVNGARQASDAALASASVEMAWLNGWSAEAVFDSEVSDVSRSYAGKGVVRYRW